MFIFFGCKTTHNHGLYTFEDIHTSHLLKYCGFHPLLDIFLRFFRNWTLWKWFWFRDLVPAANEQRQCAGQQRGRRSTSQWGSTIWAIEMAAFWTLTTTCVEGGGRLPGWFCLPNSAELDDSGSQFLTSGRCRTPDTILDVSCVFTIRIKSNQN